MTVRRVRLGDQLRSDDHSALIEAFARIRDEFEVPGPFPPEVVAEALAVQGNAAHDARADLTDVPFFTVDPAGSMDLDQAMHLEPDGEGIRVRYAIADVPAFVVPGGEIDREARRRVETLYLPDGRSPLHPPELSEGAASLLPGQVRPAFVWDLRFDVTGDLVAAPVRRARVRSVERFDYTQVQAELDSGTPREAFALLARLGTLRHERQLERGGADLPMPEQVVDLVDGTYVVRFRPPVPAEDHNAQISLATGMAAADIMLRGGVGILRTMPVPDEKALARLRRQADALGVSWPDDLSYGRFLETLERENPVHLALIHDAVALFRGAAYTPFADEAPQQRVHAGVAAPYAHVTAPLRRLVDRFGLLVCAALDAGEPVSDDVRAALAELPELMREGDRRASAVDRACTDAVEAAALAPRTGEEFGGVVVDERGEKGCLVQLVDPAVVARCAARLEPGRRVRVRVARADVATRTVELEPVEGAPQA